jgi:protein-S-isoprenylcysteine O-methyltransferase Ste14
MTVRGATLVVLQFTVFGLLVVLPGDPQARPPWAVVLGWALLVIAGLILLSAFLSLRPAFTVMPEPRSDAPLVTSGIYGYVRHPMYSAVNAAAIGLALLRWTPLAGVVALLMVAVLAIKARYEDRLLRERWSDEAVAYQRTTGALLPRLGNRR